MRQEALNPQLDLEPLAQRLRKSVLPNAASPYPEATSPFIREELRGVVTENVGPAYQQTLDRIVAERLEILAAVVVGPDERILAASPATDELVGKVIFPVSPPDGSLSSPGSSGYPGSPGYGAGGPPGYSSGGPYNSGGPPGYGTGGPLGFPGGPPGGDYGSSPGPSVGSLGTDEANFPNSPEGHLRALLYQTRPGGWPTVQVGLLSQPLFIVHTQNVCQFYVLPRPNQAAYEFATYYLGPAAGIGTLVSFAAYWLMLPWWVYLDARWRTGKAMPLALFVLLTNFLGWLTYLVIRPEGNQVCPVCVNLLEPSFRVCPYCGWSRAARCHSCGRALRSGWRFCPYCEAPCSEDRQQGGWHAAVQEAAVEIRGQEPSTGHS